jgi:hypothetical protein
LSFANTGDFVSIASSTHNNFNQNSFSMDAWIRMPSVAGTHVILDKRVTNPTNGQRTGYALYIRNGRLEIEVNGVAFTASGAPAVDDNAWHFVGAVVCRPLVGAKYVNLYVDTGQWSALPTLGGATLATVTTAVPLRIGGSWLASGEGWHGDIDEPELFSCCLDLATMNQVYTAGLGSGKCREACYLPSVVTALFPYVATNVTICNFTTQSTLYRWTLAGLPANPCTVSGPTAYLPPSGTLTVAGPGCASSGSLIKAPPMPSLATACYQLTVLDDRTGQCSICKGVIKKHKSWFAPPHALTAIEQGVTQHVDFKILNIDVVTRTCNYRIADVSTDDDSTNQIISINGNPIGAPALGNAVIDAGDSVTVGVDVAVAQFQPFVIHELTLSVGTDGDGQYDAISVQPIVAVGEHVAPADVEHIDNPAISMAPARPNPFRTTTTMSLTLPVTERVRVAVYDVLGRRVRRVQNGSLPAGRHEFDWNGRDDSGTAVGDGVYFFRLQIGSRTFRTRVVLIR